MLTKTDSSDIEADLLQIEAALRRIPNPQLRYCVAQFVEIFADGIAATQSRALAVSRDR